MSEIKPVLWIKKEHFAEFESTQADLGLTIVAWNNSLNEYAKAHELKSMEVPLYSADQLAEAVAAERERNIGIIEGERLEMTSNPSDPTDISYDMAIEHCLAAIRSAAK